MKEIPHPATWAVKAGDKEGIKKLGEVARGVRDKKYNAEEIRKRREEILERLDLPTEKERKRQRLERIRRQNIKKKRSWE